MPGKSPEELIREKVVAAGGSGSVTAEVPVPRTGPPTETELSPMLRDMRRRHRRELGVIDEHIHATTGRPQALHEWDRAQSEYLYQKRRDALIGRGESRGTRKAAENMRYLVEYTNKKFGT